MNPKLPPWAISPGRSWFVKIVTDMAQIYDFLVKLPPDGRFSAMFDSDTTSYRDLFLRGQPFKTLYAIHALRDYIDASLQIHTQQKLPYGGGVLSDQAEQAALRRSLHLTVKALSDKDILGGYPMSLQLTVANALVQLFSKLFTGSFTASKQDFRSSG